MVRNDQARNLEILRCAIAHHSSLANSRPGMTTRQAPESKFAAVIGPMKQRLALPWPASQVTRLATALDLPRILQRYSTAHVIATIPLKPPPRIVGIYPSFLSPNRERLARTYSKVIERAVASRR